MAAFIKVATFADIPTDIGLKVEAQGIEVALFRIEDQCYAIDDLCPHRGSSLAAGDFEEGIVACPLHHWRFDVTTGQMPGNPTVCVTPYPVKIEQGEVFVAIE
jgi:NAD(P)H-dependent nitrite reductase small subunit